jgi:hypothetical protein
LVDIFTIKFWWTLVSNIWKVAQSKGRIPEAEDKCYSQVKWRLYVFQLESKKGWCECVINDETLLYNQQSNFQSLVKQTLVFGIAFPSSIQW